MSALLKRCEGLRFDQKTHDEQWRNDLAKDLNEMVCRCEWTLETDGCKADVDFVEASLRVIERVATFEEVKRL